MADNWKDYQEEAAEFFRSLGFTAATSVAVQGVRTKHEVDVLVKSTHAGFEVTWIVECKYWKEAVSKLHVLALREIVSDLGADRGVLLSETGFQSGAREAAAFTNVQLTSLSSLDTETREHVLRLSITDLVARNSTCRERYWNIPKPVRIKCNLRPEPQAFGYSGTAVIDLVNELTTKAIRGTFPFRVDSVLAILYHGLSVEIKSLQEVVVLGEELLDDLESRLYTAELEVSSVDAT